MLSHLKNFLVFINHMVIYRKGRQARRTSHHRTSRLGDRISSSWLWLLIGLFVGILGSTTIPSFLTGKWPMDKIKPITQTNVGLKNTTGKLEKPTKSLKSKKLAQKKEPPQRFEFYQLLPGMEVLIPDTDNSDEILAETPQLSPTITTSAAKLAVEKQSPKINPKLAKTQTKLAAARYLIQAGAYRSLHSAETLKSRLTPQGFIPRIQKIEAEDGIWYRVTLGPFPSEAIALNQKNRLAKQKIHGVLILQRQ